MLSTPTAQESRHSKGLISNPAQHREEIDTILALEGRVELEIHDGLYFELGSNSMLDVGDLRTISKREMFLVLMSEKVNRLQPRSEKTQLKVGNVSVVHGESKDELVGDVKKIGDDINKESDNAAGLKDNAK